MVPLPTTKIPTTKSYENYILNSLSDDSPDYGAKIGRVVRKESVLEEDIAVINIALDQLGQANNFYNEAANLF